MSKIFPKAANRLPLQIVIFLVVVGGIATAGVSYYMTPKYTRVGYAPVQPVPFSHAQHAGELGIDCRYCHSNVEKSGFSNVPTSQTCMNCHNQIKTQSPLLEPIRHSYETGDPVPWVQIHSTPDFVYFNHSVHVNRGVSCWECHGQINQMEVVRHEKPLSMAWCLECHRNPEQHLRPRDQITNLDWRPASPEAQQKLGKELVDHMKILPPQSCSGCHR